MTLHDKMNDLVLEYGYKNLLVAMRYNLTDNKNNIDINSPTQKLYNSLMKTIKVADDFEHAGEEYIK